MFMNPINSVMRGNEDTFYDHFIARCHPSQQEINRELQARSGSNLKSGPLPPSHILWHVTRVTGNVTQGSLEEVFIDGPSVAEYLSLWCDPPIPRGQPSPCFCRLTSTLVTTCQRRGLTFWHLNMCGYGLCSEVMFIFKENNFSHIKL